MSHDPRLRACHTWLQQHFNCDQLQLTTLKNDASFRRYFRLQTAGQHYIVMDAPPEREDSQPFVNVAQGLKQLGLCVPEVLACDLQQGFLLLTDLGDQLYLNILTADSADRLYRTAFDALRTLQACKTFQAADLPRFDADFMKLEFDRTQTWYFQKQMGLTLTPDIRQVLEQTYQHLIESALQQPVTCIHRDYHSRNLLLVNGKHVGILDFQDAMWGPVTYDLVSLLRDCYIDWPQTKIETWALTYKAQLTESGVIEPTTDDLTFLHWFDLMGMQRHIKCLGIFTRLAHQYDKPHYLQYLDRVLKYLLTVSARHDEFTEFHQLIARCCR